MNLYLNQNKLEYFKVVTSDRSQVQTALTYFLEYIAKVGVEQKEDTSFVVEFDVLDEFSDDGYSVKLEKETLSIHGGKRGIIYAVFSFLEKIGFRFFTPELETYPMDDVFLSDFSYTECSPFMFRDVLSIDATDKVWSLKQKLNSNLWDTRKFTEAEGGGYAFAGIPAHSLTAEFLLKPYVESHPEYFSMIDGVRITHGGGQICMTNEDAIEAAGDEVLKLLQDNPERNLVSVSQGDNPNFCQCDKCQKAVQERGLLYTYYSVVNKIAKRVKEKYPKVLVHTFMYEKLCGDIDFSLEDNIMLQYCHGSCHTHAIEDESCSINRMHSKQIQELAKKCNNLFIWNYVNCFRYELFEYPPLQHFLSNTRFFAKCGVKGVFHEGMHRDQEEVGLTATQELRSYLLAKVTWNPYMDETEFQRHIEEFCEAFYGKGYKWIIKYLSLYTEMLGECASYDAICQDAGDDGYHTIAAARIIAEEKTDEFLEKANMLLEQALKQAEGEQVCRIERLKTSVLYYELFWTMRSKLARGTEKEIRELMEKNHDLIQRIKEQKLVLTFWGQWRKDQNKELEGLGHVPPSEWNYKW